MADSQPVPRISPCPHCSQRFRDRFSLAHHMETHKPQTTVKCSNCGDSMPVNAFWSHIRLHVIDLERNSTVISTVLAGNLSTFEAVSPFFRH